MSHKEFFFYLEGDIFSSPLHQHRTMLRLVPRGICTIRECARNALGSFSNKSESLKVGSSSLSLNKLPVILMYLKFEKHPSLEEAVRCSTGMVQRGRDQLVDTLLIGW